MTKDYDLAEDYCFKCKDGGDLRICDEETCLKSYHPHCVDCDTDFLLDEEHWICGRHVCSCQKPSVFQCFCCPISYCSSCIKAADFVQVKEKTKGFCFICLKLAKLIEEERNVYSDGGEIDFNNAETYQYMYKDYWEIVKADAKLTLLDVLAADALMKRGVKFQNDSDADKLFEESDEVEEDSDEANLLFEGSTKKRSRLKSHGSKSKKQRRSSSWASEKLHEFLCSIGKYTEHPQTELDVTEIVKSYVEENNLFCPHNKKKKSLVIPDEKLRKFFNKKNFKYHRIYNMIKEHLAEEYSDLNDQPPISFEENEADKIRKKQSRSTPGGKISQFSDKKNAAIIEDNIKLLYMRQSLIIELLKHPKTFETKVVGCFVKVKTDPKDVKYLGKNHFQLGQVTGIKRSQHVEKLGTENSNFLLSISNFPKDVRISDLSSNDIQQEECEDLRQLVKKGLLKQPTVADLEAKIRSVHEDITNHWITRECERLKKLIDRANEKGWHRELNQYLDTRDLLLKKEEQMRLVKEIPEVIADIEDDIVPMATERPNTRDTHDSGVEGPVQGSRGIGDMVREKASERFHEGYGSSHLIEENQATTSKKLAEEAKANDNMHISEDHHDVSGSKVGGTEEANSRVSGDGYEANDKVTGGMEQANGSMIAARDSHDTSRNKVSGRREEANRNMDGCRNSHASTSRRKVSGRTEEGAKEIPIIVLDEDDDDVEEETLDIKKEMWYYRGSDGKEYGPWSLKVLRSWESFFKGIDENIKIWKTGQRKEDAVFLSDILALAFP